MKNTLTVKGYTFVTEISDTFVRIWSVSSDVIIECSMDQLRTYYKNSPDKFFGYYIGVWLWYDL